MQATRVRLGKSTGEREARVACGEGGVQQGWRAARVARNKSNMPPLTLYICPIGFLSGALVAALHIVVVTRQKLVDQKLTSMLGR